MVKINEWLSERIEESGKTVYQLAKESGIESETLMRWYKGIHEPIGFFVEVLLNFFGYEIRIDGVPYKLDELDKYCKEKRAMDGTYTTDVSKRIGKNKNYIQELIFKGQCVRFSKFEEVVNGYGGKVEICRKK